MRIVSVRTDAVLVARTPISIVVVFIGRVLRGRELIVRLWLLYLGSVGGGSRVHGRLRQRATDGQRRHRASERIEIGIWIMVRR